MLRFDNEQLKDLLDKKHKEINDMKGNIAELETQIGRAKEL